jgi:hypothetical protein
MGKIRITINFINGMTEEYEVDPVFGWDYHGDYIVIHERVGGATIDYPYCLRDIKSIERVPGETIH